MLVGIVGKANVGKSTFFKALTLADVEIANYPFATIKPNHGIGFVRVTCAGAYFNRHCNPREGYCLDHQRFVPVSVIDVAGLVPGAHEGKGMGNQFLDDLRQADVLIHIVDASGGTNEMGESVEMGTYDPSRDVIFLEEELDYWYFGILRKGWEKFSRTVQQEKSDVARALAKQLSGLGVNEEMVKVALAGLGLDASMHSSWSEKDLFGLATKLREKTKPMVIAANKVDTEQGKKNFEMLRKEFSNKIIVPCSADSELALRGASKHHLIKYLSGDAGFSYVEESKLSAAQKNALSSIQKNVLDVFGSTGVQKILNTAVLDLLKYITVYPVTGSSLTDQDGRILPDCFLVPLNTTTLDFAYRLHTDFGKNFIRAIDLKKKITVGKEHQLRDGDVIEIVSGR